MRWRSWQLALWLLCALQCVDAAGTDDRLPALEERAIREAAALAAPSMVRIETVGGLDVIGRLLTTSGPTTGVIVASDGWVITSSFNFANRPSSILVTTPDGRRHPAQVVGTDEACKLTLLKIEAEGLTPLRASDPDEIGVGHWAIALGQTFDQSFPNVSVGIVSAVGRIWGRAIQTDAKVSPANYGGPLVDIHGRGMGILVPLSPQDTDQTSGVEWYDSGIGFAIPLADVYDVLPRLQSGETLKPGLMGVGFADRSPIAGSATIRRVRPGSPADEAGIEPEDKIIEAEGHAVARVPHLRHILGRKYAGDTLTLKVQRGEETFDVSLTLAAELNAYRRPYLGILPDRALAESEDESGVLVRLVLPGSPAEAAGIEKQDRIVGVNQFEVIDTATLREMMSQAAPGDVLAITLLRGDERIEVEATLDTFTGEIPDAIPSAEIPLAEDQVPARTGRFVDALGGEEEQRQYWAYVPDGYNPEFSYGLVIWMHPPGDTQEADLLGAWRSHCQRRGLILVGPKTSRPEGWTPDAVDFVKDLVEEFQENYHIDDQRIVLLSGRGAVAAAATIVFGQRDVFRGLALVSAPLLIPPPAADPDAPLHLHFTFSEESADAEAIGQLVEGLRELALPVTVNEIPGTDVPQMTSDRAGAIAVWIDAMDRL